MQWYTSVLKKYVTFAGRASRSEYWYFALITFIVSLILTGVGIAIGFPFLSNIYALATLLPSLAVLVRRLHDTDRSGWWVLIVITGIGAIVLLVFAIEDSKPGANKYGPNPKSIAA